MKQVINNPKNGSGNNQNLYLIPTHKDLVGLSLGKWKKTRARGKDLELRLNGITFGQAYYRKDHVIVRARFSTLRKCSKMDRIPLEDIQPGRDIVTINELWKELMDEVLKDTFTRIFRIKS